MKCPDNEPEEERLLSYDLGYPVCVDNIVGYPTIAPNPLVCWAATALI